VDKWERGPSPRPNPISASWKLGQERICICISTVLHSSAGAELDRYLQCSFPVRCALETARQAFLAMSHLWFVFVCMGMGWILSC
jgi:hypothetical protein